MNGKYNLVKTICIYPQGYCCDNVDCRLYDKCSAFSNGKKISKSKYLLTRIKPLSYIQQREHDRLYRFYNYIWGDLKDKHDAYRLENRDRYNFLNREYKRKKHPPKEYTSVLYEKICNQDCEKCPYEDCRLPEWNNRKEYKHLYYSLNKDEKKKYNQKYYQSHKKETYERVKKWRNENQDKFHNYTRNYNRNYKQSNRDKVNEYNRKYYDLHKDEINAKRREKRKLNKNNSELLSVS